MALSFHTEGRGETSLNNAKSFISTDAFNNDFYSYTLGLNSSFVQAGTLGFVSGATAAKCPAGRVLHLTGKRLVPNVNPMNTFPAGSGLATTKSPGVFMVSAYDPVSGLRGYIDPTSSKFANFDQNLPNFFDLGTQSATLPLLGGKGGKLSTSTYPMTSLSVFTSTNPAANIARLNAGNASTGMIMPVGITSVTNYTGSSITGTTLTTGSSVTIAANTFIYGLNVMPGTYVTTTVTGTSFTVNIPQTVASCTMSSAPNNVGGIVEIQTTAVKTTSNIFLTLCGNNASLLAYPGSIASSAADGYFTVYIGRMNVVGPSTATLGDGVCFSWMVVN